MKCVDFEQLIALYVEGDLLAAERNHLEKHLADCVACRSLVRDLTESQVSFKSMRDEVPDAEELALLYHRVVGEAGSPGTMTWLERFFFKGFRRTVALAGMGVMFAGAGALWIVRESRVVPSMPSQIAANVPPAMEGTSAVSAQPLEFVPLPVRRPARHPQSADASEPRQVAIKFLTDDPQVIIYWLVDEKGD